MKKIYTQPRIETVATTPQQMLCASGIKAQISGYKQNTGGGFSQSVPVIMGIVCSSLLFLGTACSTTNNPDQPKQQAELKPRTLIVTEVESRKSKVERRLPQATITDEGETLNALWSRGDEISFRNLSHKSYTDLETTDEVPLDGVLLADREARIASFTSNDKVWCDVDDQILLVYPKAAAPAITVSGDPLRATYTISLADQVGTLVTIANKYHHSYGIATITEVPLTITSLSISYGDGTYANTYPETATVTVTQGTPCTVTVTPDKKSTLAGGNPLTISPSSDLTEVYVALFPEATATKYSFRLESGENIYTGTATAQLNAGEYVVAPNLQLTKVNP